MHQLYVYYSLHPSHLSHLSQELDVNRKLDFKNNSQILLGNQFRMTEVKAFQYHNGELVKYWGQVNSDVVQAGIRESLFKHFTEVGIQSQGQVKRILR